MTPWRNAATLVAAIAVLWFASPLHAADAVTVGTVTANGTNVTVPVSIRDASGTPLGMDRPAGSKIQSFSMKITYAPVSAVQSISIQRAGITANLAPTSEFKPTTSNSISLLATFPEGSNTIPFTLDGPGAGNLIAQILVTLSPSATPSSSITLTLDPALTQLTDTGGTAATKETVANGQLTITDGRIDIPALAVSLTPTSKSIATGGTTNLTATLNFAAPSATTVTLTSSNTSVATVPSSVVIETGQKTANVTVSAVAPGTAQITASLASGPSSKSNITVTEGPAQCVTPVAPTITAPANASSGAPYTVSWNAVANATQYVLEESATADFANATSHPTTGTSMTFTHEGDRVWFYYRVRAFNRSGNCDIPSAFSLPISVLVEDVPSTRVLVVVGSTPGGFGSFFRTALQLHNPHEDIVSGKIIYHPQGTSASESDPSLQFMIPPGGVLAYDDLLPAMGLGSSVGSADIVGDEGSALPVALARVFNDGGALGTTGLTEPAFTMDQALSGGASGVIFAPDAMTHFRLNIGVRSLEDGATIDILVRSRGGATVKTATRTVPASYFRQFGATEFLDGYVLEGGETITLTVSSGAAFIYGSTTDNTTNDPSVQFVQRID